MKQKNKQSNKVVVIYYEDKDVSDFMKKLNLSKSLFIREATRKAMTKLTKTINVSGR